MKKKAGKGPATEAKEQYVRTRNLFDPGSKEPYKLSRSGIESFINCPRCFFLDRRLGIGQPSGFPLTLNNAVDALMKKEFDIYRESKTAHPLMKEYGVDAIPFAHQDIDIWRNTRQGIRYLHKKTNFEIMGAVDDVWVKPGGNLIIVDYKATSTSGEITMDDEWKEGYKRQMEIYQWLFRQNGFKVDDTGYFVFANALKDREAFNKKLEFETTIIPYKGDDSWVEKAIIDVRKCLASNKIPSPAKDCDYCRYRKEAKSVSE